MHAHPPLDPPVNGVFLVAGEIVARPHPQENEHILQEVGKALVLEHFILGFCRARATKWISLAGRSSALAVMSTRPVATALRGMPSYLAESGSWAMVNPACSLMAFRPRLPSVPMPESTMPMAFSRWSSANWRKKKSMGMRRPRARKAPASAALPGGSKDRHWAG